MTDLDRAVERAEGFADWMKRGGPGALIRGLADWLLGPRDWCVIDDGLTGYGCDVYACPRSRVDAHDVVTFDNLRSGEARRIAGSIRESRACFDPIRIAQGWRPQPRAAILAATSPERMEK